MTENLKTCTKCKRGLPYSCFKKRSDNPEKYRSQCRDCDKAYLKAKRLQPDFKEREKQTAKVYRETHKEQRSSNWKLWHQKNAEQRKEYNQLWREEKKNDSDWVEKQREISRTRSRLVRLQFPEKVLAIQARYRNKNRDKLRQKGRDYHRKNREIIANRKKLYESNLQGKTVRRLIRQRYLARKENAAGYCSPQEWQDICSQHNWKCYLCGCSLTVETVTMDHKTPLSRGGTNEPVNLAPCCSICNCRKHSKTEAEYRAILEKESARP